MNIRKAKLKDIKQVAEYGVGLMKQHYGFDPYYAPAKNANAIYLKFFKSCINSKTRNLLVAEENGKIVGYSVGVISTKPSVFKIRKFGLISDVFVEKKYRKQGIAKLFLLEQKKWFKSKKLQHIELTVHLKNEEGKKVWAKYGFEDYMVKKRVKIENFNIV